MRTFIVTLFLLSPIATLASAFLPEAEGPAFRIPAPAPSGNQALWIAVDASDRPGSTVISPDIKNKKEKTGTTARRLFLPFQADLLLRVEGNAIRSAYAFSDWRWQSIQPRKFSLRTNSNRIDLRLPAAEPFDRIRAVSWFIEDENGQLGVDQTHLTRIGQDAHLAHYFQPSTENPTQLIRKGRYGEPGAKPRIYQLLPRLFGNEKETRKINGTLAENGSGTFGDLSTPVLEKLASDGFTHLWVTGVLQQATSTDYSSVGQPADDPDLLKGIAGSPYAIRDYFDVSPDYAENPEQRLEEFKALAQRMDQAGLDLVIDFVPNHVARSYDSDIRPDLNFGTNDDPKQFYLPTNNFFYLTPEVVDGSGPLRLPTADPESGEIISETARLAGGADGLFEPEKIHGKVSGNNVVSWTPSEGDWYETVKLNYGYHFLEPAERPDYPSLPNPQAPVPDTWIKMDEIIAYWQELGVDGFRADMAHLVPPEFWKWLINRARERDPEVFFMAEAYDNDPAKVPGHDQLLSPEDGVMVYLLDAGFHAVYDDPGYDTLEHIYGQGKWANDLDDAEAALGPFFFDCAVRYTENHDEIRLAHPDTWGGLGKEVGLPVTATLFALSRGPVMIYHGQMVGEPGLGREGFGGDDQRTTIFDYWSMPEFNRWWNNGKADGGRLSDEQKELRAAYLRILKATKDPALADGNYYPLNPANIDNPFYGKVTDLGASGHWFFSFIRHDPATGAAVLVTTNLHPKSSARHIRIRLPESVRLALNLDPEEADTFLQMRDLLDPTGTPAPAIRIGDALDEGIYIEQLKPLQTAYWKLERVAEPIAESSVAPTFPAGEPFLGSVPLIRMRAGESREIDLRRFGNPGPGRTFSTTSVQGIQTSIDPLNHRITLQAAANFSGLARVPLRLSPGDNKLQTHIPVAVIPQTRHTFQLSGHPDATRVSVAGSFNGWNADLHPLKLSKGTWQITLPVEPGRHQYKFVVDGNWIADPQNPSSEEDGMGGRHSIFQVGSATDEHPVVFLKEQTNRSMTFQSTHVLREAHADAVSENGPSVPLKVKVKGTSVQVDTATSTIPEGSLIRLIAFTQDGAIPHPALAVDGEPAFDLWQDDIIYYAFTDRFHDGDPSNTLRVNSPDVLDPANYQGGDFAGIRKKIESGYFNELGINVLWLAPLNRNPAGAWQEYLPPYRHYTGYHGYWPIERFGVEPRFGGEEGLRELVAAAHGSDMKILADLVLKHVHQEHPHFRENREWFGQLELADGTRNLRRWDDNAFTTWFEPFLPAYDFRNPESISLLLEDAVHWIDTYGLDGYRLDAVKHIRPDFWWRFRTKMRDQFPDRHHYFVGETFQDRQGIAAFVGPNMLDGQFDFPLYDILIPVFARLESGFEELDQALRESETHYGKITRMSPLVGNHDKSRFMAYADGDLPDPEIDDAEEVGWARDIRVDDPAAYLRLMMALTFILSIDGVPMIYYGDEIGMTGAGDPDNRRMMRFGDEVSDPENEVRSHLSRLNHTRRAHPALTFGSRRTLTATRNHYAYLRAHGEDRAVILFNRSDQTFSFDLNLNPEVQDALLRDVLSGETLAVRGGRVAGRIPPMTSALYVLHEE